MGRCAAVQSCTTNVAQKSIRTGPFCDSKSISAFLLRDRISIRSRWRDNSGGDFDVPMLPRPAPFMPPARTPLHLTLHG